MNEEGLDAGGAGSGTGDTGTGGDAGGHETSFIETLPEDLRGNEALKAYDSPEKLARAHLETLGKIPVPPESADKYEFNVPEGKQVNQDFVNGAKAWFLEAGLSQAQAAKLAEQYIAFEDAQQAAFAKETEKHLSAVKIEWGDNYDANVAVAQQAVKEFCTPEDAKYLDESGLGNNPALIRMFYRIGQAMSEDALKGGGVGSGGTPPKLDRTAGGTPQLKFPSMEKKE